LRWSGGSAETGETGSFAVSRLIASRSRPPSALAMVSGSAPGSGLIAGTGMKGVAALSGCDCSWAGGLPATIEKFAACALQPQAGGLE